MIVLIILSILFIFIWYFIYETEGFEDEPIDPKVEEKYQKFISFYNPFMADWEKGIVTSIGLDTPVKPLTDPSQTSNATLKAPSRLEINNYIKKLEKSTEKQLPLITDPLPTILTHAVISDVNKRILMDPAPYQNALQMMVKNQEDAQNQLNAMKKSPEGFDPINLYQFTEGFETCDDYRKCMTDPDTIDAIAEAQSQQQARLQKKRQTTFDNKLDKFNTNKSIQELSVKNQEYMKKAEEIQNQAKSGELLNQMNLSNNDTSLDHFIKPQGVYKLEKMKRENPKQYAEYEKKNAKIMGEAGLFNSISNTLAR